MAAASRTNRILLALIAGVTAFSAVLSVGSANARLIDWASTEFIYIPSEQASYSSDCLIPGGQQILLADWKPEEQQREITIGVVRPAVQEPETTIPQETTLPTETEPTETTLPEETEPETTTEPTETEATEPSEVEETVPEETEPEETTEPVDLWQDTEATVTLDAAADAQMTCTVQVNENDIQLLLARRDDAQVLQDMVTATIHVKWFDVEGTFVIRLLPEATAVSGEEETESDRTIVTGLDPVLVNDTINPEKPITCVKLNLNTLSDFTLTFLSSEKGLNKVRWSVDGGATYSLLYDSNTLTLNYPYTEGWDGTLFLDFSLCLTEEQRPTISVAATGYDLEECTPVLLDLPVAEQLILKAANLPHTILVSPTWGAAKLQLLPIQHLAADETGALVYQDDASLVAEVTGQGIRITTSNPGLLPASGSYRMQIQWIWSDTVVEEQILYFFVNTN